jgi:voltage-gated potassium channel
MEFTYSHLGYFVDHLEFAAPLLGLMATFIISLGLIVGRIESWNWFDSIYWAFIIATTVGYGDIRPLQPVPNFLSILVALVGVTFTGLLVALAVDTATLLLDDVRPPGDAAAAHTAVTVIVPDTWNLRITPRLTKQAVVMSSQTIPSSCGTSVNAS